jgi:hypothetical protein
MPINRTHWVERGKALYASGAAERPPLLTLDDARLQVIARLRGSLVGLSDADQAAALRAAVRGFVQAHTARGRHLVEALPGPGAPLPAFPPLRCAPPAPTRPGTEVRPLRPRDARPGPPPEATAVSFAVVEDHPLTRGLLGGRVRIPRGESAVGAVVRRIERDTRCEVTGVQSVGEFARHFRVSLRGSNGERGPGGRVVEGAIVVRI